MSCILDIDLDYFRLFNDLVRRLDEVLEWADRPVDFVVGQHHHVVKHWSAAIKRGLIETPTFIVHADEHHDMRRRNSLRIAREGLTNRRA